MSDFATTTGPVPDQHTSLPQWLAYWNSIHVTAIDLGLERIRPVAEYLQLLNPDATVITVAGTNGKGSTTTTIAAIYQAVTGQAVKGQAANNQTKSYRVGLYQSPHIYRFNERIKLNGCEVEDAVLVAAFVQIEVARVACQLSLSFFEATTLAAFLIFKQQQCDVWVLEVGLGGRLDAVNLIDPDVAVITNIGIDHVEWLGDSIEKIAFEKAGIMRQGIPVIYAEPVSIDKPVPQAIVDQAARLGCSLYCAGRDYHWQLTQNGFYYASPAVTLSLPLPRLAAVNVAGALSAVLLAGLPVDHAALEQGIKNALIAGRFELRTLQQRSIILDVAHNVHGVAFLRQQLAAYLQQYNVRPSDAPNLPALHLVFSMLADKDISGVAAELSPIVNHWHIAPLDTERAATLTQLRSAVEAVAVQSAIHEYRNVTAAFAAALQQSQPHDIIMVCGSFHTLEAVWESLASWQ
ncbi:MAG: bifunctional tetrahydrofolate synthase/dihydrofolate synthase [Moraxellaceae bacterium]|nr:MAG: bifunctional tetrahydrofolate synthase/dihydrofolate synthase [Moraxellaceae bacterium]